MNRRVSCATSVYERRIEFFQRVEIRLARTVSSLSVAVWGTALSCTLLAAVSLFLNRIGLMFVLVPCLATLMALVFFNERARYDLRRTRELKAINKEALARVARRWNALSVPPASPASGFSPVSADLEVFGRASLFALICTAETRQGVGTLRDWLSEAAPAHAIRDRQEAVAKLAPELERRQELQACARLLSRRYVHPETFLDWAQSERPTFFPRWLLWLVRMNSVLVCLSAVGLVLGIGYAELHASVLGLVICLNLLLTAVFGGRIYDLMRAVLAGAADARAHYTLYRIAAGVPATAAALARISSTAQEAMREMRRLERVAVLSDLRRWWIYYFPLQCLFLWDFHILELMESWKQRCGTKYSGWYEAIGELEALCSFAQLLDDNPDWCFPTMTEKSAGVIEAHGMGHPLLPGETRVSNDVVVGPAGTVLMVTGSNMSGKSTLLRSLGTNIILAQAGAPVCASDMTLPPTELVTVVRVTDSLENGVSLFMAELQRLRGVVERAEALSSNPEKQLCYILDEILHGTNSAERHLASLRVLQRLVASGAIGAVSTHDLALCVAEPIGRFCNNVHFQETMIKDGPDMRMTFDYHLRQGIASTTNVGYLLDAIGIHDLTPCADGEPPPG
jgi:hypothetical protein